MAVLRIILIILFLIAALVMTVVVLMQEGKSAGLGAIGTSGGGESYWDKNKKHSLEGKFERWTKIMAGVMMITAFIIMFIPVNNSSSNSGSTTNIESQVGTDTTEDATGTTDAETEAGTDATENAEGTEGADTTGEEAPVETPAE